jgi:hypothetical protein
MATRCHVLAAVAFGFIVTQPVLAAQASSPTGPTGQISGRVLDADGGRPPAIRVEVMRLAADGSHRLEPIASARANDDGSYRIEGLPAGEYYVAAVGIVDAGTPGKPEAPPPTYYPGVFDELEAQAVSLGERGHVSDVDFRLRTDPGVRVTGIMVSHNNKPLRTGQVTISRVNQSGTVVGQTARARIYPDGSFFALNILPGRYLLSASGQTFARRESLVASQIIEVSSVSVTGLRLVLQPGGSAPVQPTPPQPAPVQPTTPQPSSAEPPPPVPPAPPAPSLEPVPPSVEPSS